MTTASIRRRAAAPVGFLAAIALAAGGGSAPWSISPSDAERLGRPASNAAGPRTVHLEHVELVALRAQSAPGAPAR